MDAPHAGRQWNPAQIETRILTEMLPESVASAEVFGDLDGVTLFAQEQTLVERAVDKRRRTFATGRGCARHALGALGFAPEPILRDEHGVPLWPEGVVGSITHCDGYCAAAVAWLRNLRSIGIDAEPNLEIPSGVLARIALPAEQAWLRDYTATDPAVSWGRLLFSIKEAVYKARYQLVRGRLDFAGPLIAVDPLQGTFTAQVQDGEPAQKQISELAGRWCVQDDLLVTTATVPLADSAGAWGTR